MSILIPAPPPEFGEALKEQAIELDPGDLERVTRYLELLYETNERMNLTAVRDPAAAWMRHIFDALTLLPIVAESGAARVADIGSGGGVPGLVLACVLPEVEMTLIESVGKKARFLEETAAALGLARVRVQCARAEALGRGALKGAMDLVVCRAVARLPVLLGYAMPLLKGGGVFVAIKGEQATAELEASAPALRANKGTLVDTRRTPTGTLVIIEKIASTRRSRASREGERPHS